MFKVNNNWCCSSCSSVFIVNFEQVNAGWTGMGSTDEVLKHLCFYIYFEGKLSNSANTFMLFIVLVTPNIYLQILFCQSSIDYENNNSLSTNIKPLTFLLPSFEIS